MQMKSSCDFRKQLAAVAHVFMNMTVLELDLDIVKTRSDSQYICELISYA